MVVAVMVMVMDVVVVVLQETGSVPRENSTRTLLDTVRTVVPRAPTGSTSSTQPNGPSCDLRQPAARRRIVASTVQPRDGP